MKPDDDHDPERFERLVTSHGPRVHAYLARRAPHDADDLLAEVWVTAYANRHRYDAARGEVAPWLFGIARNVLLTHYRGVRLRANLPVTASEAEDSTDTWAAVDDRLDAINATARLRFALAAMPPDERDVLLLVAWEQLSPTEAAAVLGIPAGTARSRLHRARTRLARHAREASDPGNAGTASTPSLDITPEGDAPSAREAVS